MGSPTLRCAFWTRCNQAWADVDNLQGLFAVLARSTTKTFGHDGAQSLPIFEKQDRANPSRILKRLSLVAKYYTVHLCTNTLEAWNMMLLSRAAFSVCTWFATCPLNWVNIERCFDWRHRHHILHGDHDFQHGVLGLDLRGINHRAWYILQYLLSQK